MPLARTRRHAIALAASLALAAPAFAATCTWSGAANSNMNDAGNWSCPGGGPNLPGTGDMLIFPAGAQTLTVNNDFIGTSPSFYDVSFAPGYTLQGSTLTYTHLLTITGPFTNSAAMDGGMGALGTIQVNGAPGAGLTFLGTTTGIGGLTVGNGVAQAHAVLGSVNPALPITVAAQGALSMRQAVTATTLSVQSGGTLVISEPSPNNISGDTVGSATVTGATTLAAGAALEYRALTLFDPGVLTAQGGIALNGATLRIVVEDPANPDAIGLQRTLVGYGDSTQLTGTFAGLPANGALIEASNAPGVWYSISYGSNSNAFIQITRVAAPPPVVPGSGVASVPVFGPAGLGLLSALVAGAGALRRRKRF